MILLISCLLLFSKNIEAFSSFSTIAREAVSSVSRIDRWSYDHSQNPDVKTITCKRIGHVYLAMNTDSSGMSTMNPSNNENGNYASMKTFDQLGIPQLLVDIVKNQRWDQPTPIQRIAIPAILNLGNDRLGHNSIWAEAPTGSGKTAAYLIPLIQLILQVKKERRMMISSKTSQIRSNSNSAFNARDEMGSVTTLILSPTRELASQIGTVAQRLMNSNKDLSKILNIAILTGGTPIEPQIDMLVTQNAQGQNLDILIATPGRLIDVLLYHNPKARSDSIEEISSITSAQDKELEKQLLAALDGKIEVADANKVGHKRKRKSTTDMSLSFHEIQKLKINEMISSGRDGGRSTIHNILSNVRYLVLDEADRLLSTGFKNEMDQIINLLPSALSSSSFKSTSEMRPTLKTMLFSATFPKQIEPRVYQLLESLYGKQNESSIPLRLLVDVKSTNSILEYDSSGSILSLPASNNLQVQELGNEEEDVNATTSHELTDRQQRRLEKKHAVVSPHISIQGSESTIDQRIIRMEVKDRTSILRKLLEEYGSEQWDRVLVFVSTRSSCEHVAQKLIRANICAAELHGKLDHDDRIRRLEDFRRGKIQVLIATDLASRGLDVAGLPAVVNYDLPRSTADFIHRIGRCGRAQTRGTAISFVTPTNEAHMDLIEKRHFKQSRSIIPREIMKGFEPDEEKWLSVSAATRINIEGIQHSDEGIAFDRMHGGIKGKRKSKKDKIREKAVLDQRQVENTID